MLLRQAPRLKPIFDFCRGRGSLCCYLSRAWAHPPSRGGRSRFAIGATTLAVPVGLLFHFLARADLVILVGF